MVSIKKPSHFSYILLNRVLCGSYLLADYVNQVLCNIEMSLSLFNEFSKN